MPSKGDLKPSTFAIPLSVIYMNRKLKMAQLKQGLIFQGSAQLFQCTLKPNRELRKLPHFFIWMYSSKKQWRHFCSLFRKDLLASLAVRSAGPVTWLLTWVSVMTPTRCLISDHISLKATSHPSPHTYTQTRVRMQCAASNLEHIKIESFLKGMRLLKTTRKSGRRREKQTTDWDYCSTGNCLYKNFLQNS